MKFFNFLLISFFALSLIGCVPEPIDPPPGPIILSDTTIKDISYGANGSQKFDLGLPANRTTAST